ncbi:putative ATP binding protein, partial [Tanacetum coccineum]
GMGPTMEDIRAEYVTRRDDDPLDIICMNKPGDNASLHVDMKDVYLLGFTVNGRSYEYGKTGKITHDIPGSTFGCDSDFIDFGESASRIAFERVASSTNLPPPGAGHVYTEDDVGIALEDCIIEFKPVRVLERLWRVVENRYVPCLLVQWNNTEVNWKTETRMHQDFQHFETRVIPPPPVSGGHLTLVGSCSSDKQIYLWEI